MSFSPLYTRRVVITFSNAKNATKSFHWGKIHFSLMQTFRFASLSFLFTFLWPISGHIKTFKERLIFQAVMMKILNMMMEFLLQLTLVKRPFQNILPSLGVFEFVALFHNIIVKISIEMWLVRKCFQILSIRKLVTKG